MHSTESDSDTTTYSHTQNAHNTASHNPPTIPDGALQQVWPDNLGHERGCDVAERDETLGCRSGNEIEGGGEDDDI